jgi:hypothetical protein
MPNRAREAAIADVTLVVRMGSLGGGGFVDEALVRLREGRFNDGRWVLDVGGGGGGLGFTLGFTGGVGL